jgi:hypothetical protein
METISKKGASIMLKLKFLLYVSLISALCLSVQGLSVAQIFFKDDFEKDEIGKEPKNWEYDPGAEVKDRGKVAVDPLEPKNKVFTGYGGYKANKGEQYIDFVAEWDWMFHQNNNRNNSIGFRVVDPGRHYQLSRRSGGIDWKIYMYNGAWNEIVTAAFPTKIDIWYRVQLTVQGEEFTVKAREKNDQTPFAKLKPVLKIKDGTYKKGAFETSYWGPIDNVIIAASEADILPVEAKEKLAISWGKIKITH